MDSLTQEKIDSLVHSVNEVIRLSNKKKPDLPIREIPENEEFVILTSKQELQEELGEDFSRIDACYEPGGKIYLTKEGVDSSTKRVNSLKVQNPKLMDCSLPTEELVVMYLILHENIHRSSEMIELPEKIGAEYLGFFDVILEGSPLEETVKKILEQDWVAFSEGAKVTFKIKDGYFGCTSNRDSLDEFLIHRFGVDIFSYYLVKTGSSQSFQSMYTGLSAMIFEDLEKVLSAEELFVKNRFPEILLYRDYFSGVIPIKIYDALVAKDEIDENLEKAVTGITLGLLDSLPSILKVLYTDPEYVIWDSSKRTV